VEYWVVEVDVESKGIRHVAGPAVVLVWKIEKGTAAKNTAEQTKLSSSEQAEPQ
jgi:hypothetical protein